DGRRRSGGPRRAFTSASPRLPVGGPARVGDGGTGDALPIRDRGLAVPPGSVRDRGHVRSGPARAGRRWGAGDRGTWSGSPDAGGRYRAGHAVAGRGAAFGGFLRRADGRRRPRAERELRPPWARARRLG